MTTATRYDDAAAAAAVGAPPRLSNDCRSRPTGSVSDAAGTGDRPRVPATHPVGGATVTDLLCQRAELPAGHPDRAALRARSIEAGLPLARSVAARYAGRGEPFEDLHQVAALALIKAVDRYDPDRQTAFASYAVPCIVGALKRHFRDATWRVRVPRRIQDLALTLGPTSAELAQQLGRSPTRRELAAHLDTAEPDITIALNAWRARCPDSLDARSAASGDEPRALIDKIGGVDARLQAVSDRHSLLPLLAALPLRQRRILAMRYVADMTQAEIATQVGVSQMHISRLLVHSLAQLRTAMLAEQR